MKRIEQENLLSYIHDSFYFSNHFREDCEDITHNSKVGDGEYGIIGVFVDSYNDIATRHSELYAESYLIRRYIVNCCWEGELCENYR